MSGVGGKADIVGQPSECPLIARSGHSHFALVGRIGGQRQRKAPRGAGPVGHREDNGGRYVCQRGPGLPLVSLKTARHPTTESYGWRMVWSIHRIARPRLMPAST